MIHMASRWPLEFKHRCNRVRTLGMLLAGAQGQQRLSIYPWKGIPRGRADIVCTSFPKLTDMYVLSYPIPLYGSLPV
jgi:hypothetical protein